MREAADRGGTCGNGRRTARATTLVAVALAAGALCALPAQALTVGGCKVKPHANCAHKQLIQAKLNGANLSGAILVGNFQNDSFTGANLSGVKYCNATIEGVLHNEAGGCPTGLIQ
jgi:hypothetical protein